MKGECPLCTASWGIEESILNTNLKALINLSENVRGGEGRKERICGLLRGEYVAFI